MKKFLVILTTLFVSLISANVQATPTCVMMKFTNDTRYQNIDSASVLSDLVMEKLLARTNLNFVETRPIDENLEMQLYDEKTRDILATEIGTKRGNFNILFENGTFDKNHAQSIATAEVGQIVSPAITSQIGRQHGAEYLIQGTIISMGDNLTDKSSSGYVYLRERKSVMAVVAEVKVIKVSTGEVVWSKISIGDKSNALTQIGMFKLGSAKLNAEMYNTAMSECAEKIVADLLEDLNANKVFVK